MVDATENTLVSQVRGAIRNPENPHHFMVLQPVGKRVRLWWGETLLADTKDALRLIEVGNGVYEPTYYVPTAHIAAELEAVPEKATHCPLKGKASYYMLDGEEVGWSYDAYDFAQALHGRIAFSGKELRIEIGG